MPDTRNDPGSRQTPTAGDAEGLLSWFFDKDSQVMAAARYWPACWGGQFRVGEARYATEEDVLDALSGPLDLNLYYALCDCDRLGGALPLSEIAAHAGDAPWLASRAAEYIEQGGAVFYTEAYPDDFDECELAELAKDRPDLFTEESVREYPRLQAAVSALGVKGRNGEAARLAKLLNEHPLSTLSTAHRGIPR
ncbi:hypothetical protein [Rubneribacter sp.]|nr:hypothetical protein [Candidatus Rubneribacter avistercoris]